MDNWKEIVASCGDQKLSAALIWAVGQVLTLDRHLLEVVAHENCIAATLRCYMLSKIRTWPDHSPWDVDFDYNRKLAKVKTVKGERLVRPDLVVHRRGSNANLLAMEVKKGHSNIPDDRDLAKLAAFRSPSNDGGLGYNFALFLRFGVKSGAGKIACVQWV